LTNETTGVLLRPNGGTGLTGPFANGELFIGDGTTGDLQAATLTAGPGISITNGPGSITIASSIEYHLIHDAKSANVPGGTAVDATYRTRDLNTVLSSTGAVSLLSLTSNVFTLAAGTYYIEGWSTAYNATSSYTTRLVIAWNSNSTAAISGVAMKGLAGQVTNPRIFGVLAPTTSTGYILQMRIDQFGSTNDYGPTMNDGAPEYYTELSVLKI
jgi:hypothetical protein